jgi:hypothetical protein
MRNRCVCLSMVLLGVCLFGPQKSLAQSTIACNSNDGRRHTCSADTRGGVRLVTRHSEAACTEGYSWGFDSEASIWVDHGCRADFSVGGNGTHQEEKREEQAGGNGESQAQAIACNSQDGERHTCTVDTRGGGVRLVTQHSESACREGYSWGSDDGNSIWVDHGCRADFSVGGNGGYREEKSKDQEGRNEVYRDKNRREEGGGNAATQTFACNSDDMKRHSCAVNTQGGGVRLVTQRSASACTKDYSWGTNRRGIWVDHGCRGDFAVTAKDQGDSLR